MTDKIKAVIFDMDGVLIDAKEWHYQALNLALSDFGLNPISESDHLTKFDGLSTDQKLNILIKENNFDLKNKINNLKQNYTWDIARENLQPVKQHIDLMEKLREEGYKLAVCSNSIRKTVEIFMNGAALAQYMEFMLSNEDIKNKKPSPDIYNKVIKMLNLTPKNCLIVEDNFNGIKAANDSGAYVLEVKSVKDVYYENIKNKINQIEQ